MIKPHKVVIKVWDRIHVEDRIHTLHDHFFAEVRFVYYDYLK